ncbi:MAG TPA: hypothetical protein VMD92_06050 [Acidobacteriaceae bacterium]|nr:hypothetical protein [Acidobacteriaceae bacterium]
MHARYNPPQRMISRPRLVFVAALLFWLLPKSLQPQTGPAGPWDQPAADLARQIAALAGPGSARLVIRNNSSLATGEIPAIRLLLEHDLRSFGVVAGSSDGATTIRVTLSQNTQGGLWVAEVLEGTESLVAMVPVTLKESAPPAASAAITLRRTLLATEPDPILDAAVVADRLIVLEPEQILVYPTTTAARSATGDAGVTEAQIFPIEHTRSFPRDLRGRIFAAQDHFFDAYLPGVLCTGSNAAGQVAVTCAESDDPWPITATQRAFYNAMRNYFTGILAPGYGMDLAPFYNAADLPRPTGSAVLLNPVSGNVMLVENATAKPVSGANDWGSDFAVIRSGCGSGAQVLVSGSGAAAAGDTLRAFEISGREAIAVSAPLPIDGAITAMSPAPDGTTATIIVRRDAPLRYEASHVAALCN